MQCMGEAFGLKLDDEETKKRLSIKPLTLPKVFDMGLKVLSAAGLPQRTVAADTPPGERSLEEVRQQQQTAQDQAAWQRAAGGSAASAGAGVSSTTSSGGGDARLLEKFIATLKTRGFFEGLEEGTPAWYAASPLFPMQYALKEIGLARAECVRNHHCSNSASFSDGDTLPWMMKCSYQPAGRRDWKRRAKNSGRSLTRPPGDPRLRTQT